MDPNAAVCMSCGFAKGTGNKYCSNCGNGINEGAAICTNCGFALQGAQGTQNIVGVVPPGYEQKSKMIAGLLQIFLGGLGIGRFYLGYTNIGIFQILASFLCGAGILWGLIDGIMILTGSVKNDGKGVPLKS